MGVEGRVSRIVLPRRQFLFGAAGLLIPAIAGCHTPPNREPDHTIEDQIGTLKIWGTKSDDGSVDYKTGEYQMQIKPGALTQQLKYPYSLAFDFQENAVDFAVEYAERNELGLLGAFRDKGSRSFAHQWTYKDTSPNYKLANTANVAWNNLRFKKVVWNGKTVVEIN